MMKNKKTTGELMKLLKQESNYDNFYRNNRDNFSDMTFLELFEKFLEENHISKSMVIKRSGLTKSYAYEVLRENCRKVPSRDKVLMLCIGMGASMEQARALLLKLHLAPLYAKEERDSIILFGLYHKLSVVDINIKLYDRHLAILE